MNPEKEEEKRRELENLAAPFLLDALSLIDQSIIASIKTLGVPFVSADARAEAMDLVAQARLIGWDFVRSNAVDDTEGEYVYADNDADTYAAEVVDRMADGSLAIAEQAKDNYTSQEVALAVVIAALLLARRTGRVQSYTIDAVHGAVEIAKFNLVTRLTMWQPAMPIAPKQTKIWWAVMDSKTRRTHAKANGQEVGIQDTFTVGGHAMRYPKDRSAPIKETANCRCQVKYSIKWGI